MNYWHIDERKRETETVGWTPFTPIRERVAHCALKSWNYLNKHHLCFHRGNKTRINFQLWLSFLVFFYFQQKMLFAASSDVIHCVTHTHHEEYIHTVKTKARKTHPLITDDVFLNNFHDRWIFSFPFYSRWRFRCEYLKNNRRLAWLEVAQQRMRIGQKT